MLQDIVENVQYMAELAAHDRENGVDGEEEEEYSDEEERSGAEEEEDDEEEEGEVVAPPPTRNLHQTEEDKEREVLASISANSTTVLEGETDRFGNLRIAEPAVDESDEEEEEDSEEDTEEEDSEEEDSDVGSVAPSQAPRMRPKRQTRDVESIVTAKLNRQHKSSERKHHGKKTASSNVLGRQKGSKKKTSHNAAIKEGKKGNAFF